MRAFILGFILISFGTISAAQICGQTYRIEPGDTLGSVATAAYGDRSHYQTIFQANFTTLGENPDLVRVGTMIDLPCLDMPVEKVETVAFANMSNREHERWSVLVNPEKLGDLAAYGAVQILDIRSDKARAKGALPGTINIPYGAWRGPRDNPGQPPTDAELSQTIGAAGLRLNEPIVILHGSAAAFDTGRAAYVYWVLKSVGATRLALLPGGFSALDGTQINLRPSQRYTADLTMSDQWYASQSDVQGLVTGSQPGQLLDARPSKMFSATAGQATTLPGALNGPIDQTHGASGNTPEAWAILSMMKGQPVNWQSQPVVSFCNTGELGALSWFYASEVSGIDNVKLYPQSIKGWKASGAALVAPDQG
ncbi:rhodanese-like domain-containing protein [Actibacterium sp. 188UL27-1]|uniref:rhodanese-like domain-containing protein n=1 Tax=Actibacterium sp. 188UL27-1 TaxID=2786961 RepID=UPI00195DB5C9|nr:rhodanese-like domain-containing protein [Actibacterium sp. 188UL27-1]MBM7066256.1 hypothetical protein [Actibacterium sp. 188UL27-1]